MIKVYKKLLNKIPLRNTFKEQNAKFKILFTEVKLISFKLKD